MVHGDMPKARFPIFTLSPLQFLSINIPLWDLEVPFSILETIFSFESPMSGLSFSADRALHALDWLLHGLTSFKPGEDVLLLNLLYVLCLMPGLNCFILFKCTVVWDEDDVFPSAPVPISTNRLDEFVMHSECLRCASPFTMRRRRDLRSPRWRHQDLVPGQFSLRPWLRSPSHAPGEDRNTFASHEDQRVGVSLHRRTNIITKWRGSVLSWSGTGVRQPMVACP